MLEKSFGDKIKGITYKDRVGAYAVIINNHNELLTVKTEKGYFLLGGKIENNETYEACIKRECIEEAGVDVEVKEFICKAGKYTFIESLKFYIHAVGYFYIVKLKDKVCEPIEKNHKLEWINLKEYDKKLHLEHQSWAVVEAIKLKNIYLYKK